MSSFIEVNKLNNYDFIFSLLYMVRTIRNPNINNVTYLENLSYVNKNFNKKIYKNGDIIYIKSWNTWDESLKKKYKSNQKWIIVYFYDKNNEFSYDIQPYFEKSIISDNTKINIDSDRVLIVDEEQITTNILEFRKKYENSFLIIMLYLCFLNCLTILSEENNHIFRILFKSPEIFLKIFEKNINTNSYLFENLC